MSNRAIYAFMAALTLAAVLGLWFLIKGDGDDATVTTTSAKAETGSASGFTGPQHHPAGAPDQPALPAANVPADLPPKVKEYAANGAIIRDHRTGSHEVFEPTTQAPANDRKIPIALTKAVSDKVRDAVHDCAQSVPKDVMGGDARLEGSINIAIKSGVIIVNQANVNVRGVTGDPAEAARACIAQKALAITHPAADEADLPSYDITLSLNLI